ncbi:MAG: GntR family transcriptional regulator [Gaiellales bacterium]
MPKSRVIAPSMVEQTCSILRERIRTGELPAGTRLRQEVLAEELGISRTPLREAMRLLAADGLVELEPNRGAVVTALSREAQVQFWRARLALEPAAARLGAETREPTALKAMARAIADQRAGTAAAGFAANRAFHLALVQSAGNAHLDRFAESLWVQAVGTVIYDAQAGDPAIAAGYADDHQAILDAITAGDAELAERRTREHILASPVPD